jgi:hypothetical protein
MPFISDTQLARVQSAMSSMATRANRAAEKAREKTAQMMRVAEIVGGAAASGFIRGRREKEGKDFNLPGTTIDMELLSGLGLSAAAMFEVFGKYDEDALNVGGGMLAHYAGQVFRNYGKTGNMTPLVAGHNYPYHGGIDAGARYPERLGGGASSLIGANAMSDALRSALSASP